MKHRSWKQQSFLPYPCCLTAFDHILWMCLLLSHVQGVYVNTDISKLVWRIHIVSLVLCTSLLFFIFSLDFQFPLIFVFCRAKLKGLRLKYRYTEANMRKAIQEERTKKEFSHWRFKKQKAVFKRLPNKLHEVVSNFYCQIVCMSTQLNFV